MNTYQEYVNDCKAKAQALLRKGGYILQYKRVAPTKNVSYGRDKNCIIITLHKGHPQGVAIAFQRNGEVYVGVSLRHRRERQTWNKYVAIVKAMNCAVRLDKIDLLIKEFPDSMLHTLSSVIRKAHNYFYHSNENTACHRKYST